MPSTPAAPPILRPATVTPRNDPSDLGVIVSVAIWGPLTLWVGYHLFGMISACNRADTLAVQQAASAAMSATYILAGYVVARAADAVLYRGVRSG